MGLLLFSHCDLRHYGMPAWCDKLVAVVQRLRDPLSRGMFRQAVTAVLRTVDFVHGDSSPGDLVLDPQLAELYVSHFSEPSTVCNAFRCAGVGTHSHM